MFVKICGVTSEEDALLAVALGADAIGFIFAPSVRQVRPDQVRDIVRRLPPEVITVGVFRDELPARVVEIVNSIGLGAAQLHGHETPDQARWVRERIPFVIQGFSAGSRSLAGADEWGADVVLVDSARPGSGRVFDWSLADGVPDGVRLLLAGGLTPENVGDAIAQLRPWGVDVATGVESAPGVKDPVLLRRFLEVARTAADDPDPEAVALARDHRPYDWELDEERARHRNGGT